MKKPKRESAPKDTWKQLPDVEWLELQRARYVEARPRFEQMRQLLHDCLQRAAPRTATVQSRVKAVASFAERISKSRRQLGDPLADVADICACRVIVHTDDELTAICQFIETHFVVNAAMSTPLGKALSTSHLPRYVIRLNRDHTLSKELPVKIPNEVDDLQAVIEARTLREHARSETLRIAPKIEVFISAKSADYSYAKEVFEFLKARGVNAFLSKESLPALGSSDYRKEIDLALDQAQHMVVVTSSKENVESSWVEAEWGFFINEKRSGRKRGNLMTMLAGGLPPNKLPPSLRYYEAMTLDNDGLQKLLSYIHG